MSRMFLILLSVFAFFSGEILLANEVDPSRVLVSSSDEHYARQFFTGPDQEMPLTGDWLMTISPTISDGEVQVPGSLLAAWRELEDALPHWYLRALIAGRNDYECRVVVNNRDYHLNLFSWLWVNWNLSDEGSSLRKELVGLGADSRQGILFGIHDGLCYYLRYGEEEALDLIGVK